LTRCFCIWLKLSSVIETVYGIDRGKTAYIKAQAAKV